MKTVLTEVRTPSKCPAKIIIIIIIIIIITTTTTIIIIIIIIITTIIIIIKGSRNAKEAGKLKSKNENFVCCPPPYSQSVGGFHACF